MQSAWPTLGILLAGVVVVVGGVLLLRLHAFLALILGALLVGLLTPAATVEQFHLEQAALPVLERAPPVAGEVLLDLGREDGARVGMRLLLLRHDPVSRRYGEAAELEIVDFSAVDPRRPERAVAAFRDGAVTMAPGDLVLDPLRSGTAVRQARRNVGERVASGFGTTAGQIGILIAMASIIGKCLLDSGAADRVVRSMLRLLGERGAPLSFLWSGFLLGIPVFFDTVFYLMIPLGKAMRMRTGRNYLLYVLTIVAGATMAHSLVPPTPGPLFVAQQLEVNVGAMILAGFAVGILTSTFGYLYAVFVSRLWELPLRESPDVSLAELEQAARRPDAALPPLWLSLLPIVLPVLLIGGAEALRTVGERVPADLMRTALFVGDKNVALVLSAALALGLLLRQTRGGLAGLAAAAQAALAGGGVIILITGAGGAFGEMLRQTGVGGLIGRLTTHDPLLVVLLAFGITTAIRTAQGSATVAMVTAVGVLSGLAGNLPFDPVYLALAIGCGSKPIAWMNDSGFWVIVKMSGMTEAEGLKFVTPMTSLMGVVGLLAVMAGVIVAPFPFG